MKNSKDYFCILILLVLTDFISGQDTANHNFSINLKLSKHITQTTEFGQICGTISFINLNHRTIEIEPEIQCGWDGTDPFTLQAFDLNDKFVDISCNCDYDFILSEDFIKFQKGDTLSKTIASNLFMIKNKGQLKLRVLFRPDYLILKEGELVGPVIYSNWDTLTVR